MVSRGDAAKRLAQVSFSEAQALFLLFL